jgi:hypothetical protein
MSDLMWYKFQGGGSELLKVEGPLKTVVQLGSCKCWYALRTPCPDWDTCYLDILPITLVYDDPPSRSVSWKDNTGLTTTVGSCECWYTKRYPCGDCDIALKPGNEVIERGALDVYPRRKVFRVVSAALFSKLSSRTAMRAQYVPPRSRVLSTGCNCSHRINNQS